MFCLISIERRVTITLIIRRLINFRVGALTEKSVRYSLSFSPRDLPEEMFAEMNFSKVLPNLKMVFSIVFNLVSKLRSCSVAAAEIARAGFIFTISDAEEIAVVVIVEKKVRVLLLIVIIGAVA